MSFVSLSIIIWTDNGTFLSVCVGESQASNPIGSKLVIENLTLVENNGSIFMIQHTHCFCFSKKKLQLKH